MGVRAARANFSILFDSIFNLKFGEGQTVFFYLGHRVNIRFQPVEQLIQIQTLNEKMWRFAVCKLPILSSTSDSLIPDLLAEPQQDHFEQKDRSAP